MVYRALELKVKMKHCLNILVLLILFSFMGEELSAQYYRNQGYWKKFRSQLTVGIGTSNFLGELGGRDQVGSDFIWDLETKVFKPAFSLGYRYHFTANASVNTQFSFAVLSGDDALTREPFRFNRNLHFRSRIFELSSVFEYVLVNLRPGHRYDLEGVKGQKPRSVGIFVFAGIGGMKFNPQAKAGDSWYDLKPLGTEGQNFKEGPDPYSLYGLVVPMGLGIRWRPSNENYFIGLTIGHRKTFTDYIDDVSTVYYDGALLGNQPGLSDQDNVLAEYFGDPSLGYYLANDGSEVALVSTGTGAQRGDETDNDAYLFGQLTFSYAFHKQPYKRVYKKAKRGKRIVF
jgi:hypothetical protein